MLRTAHATDLVEATDELLRAGTEEMFGAFPVGPTHGDDYLPVEPLEAMRRGLAHRVPLIVGTNADEGRLFTRFLKLLPTNEPMIEALLAEAGPEVRARITAAYPDYPHPEACVRLGRDFAFASAAWDIAEAHSTHAPTYRYRYDYAPRTLKWSGLGATHATELLAVFDVYRTRFGSLLTAAGDQRSAARVTRDVRPVGGHSAAPVCPETTGRSTTTTNGRCWCSTGAPASSSIPTRIGGRRGRASPRRMSGPS